MNRADEGVLVKRAKSFNRWDEIARSALANYPRTSLFLCPVSFPPFRAYDAKRTRGHEMGKSQKWHGVKQRLPTQDGLQNLIAFGQWPV
jgi:hypothetical protein